MTTKKVLDLVYIRRKWRVNMTDMDFRRDLGWNIHYAFSIQTHTHIGFPMSFRQIESIQLYWISCIRYYSPRTIFYIQSLVLYWAFSCLLWYFLLIPFSDIVRYYYKLMYKFVGWCNCLLFSMLLKKLCINFVFKLMYRVRDSLFLGFLLSSRTLPHS